MTARPLSLEWVNGRPRVLRYGRPLGEPALAESSPPVNAEQARAVLEAGSQGEAWRAVLEAGPEGAAQLEQLEQLEERAAAELARMTWRRACANG
jgi:hypothetical protein